jgi:putative peptidoglycan lipid II flippase
MEETGYPNSTSRTISRAAARVILGGFCSLAAGLAAQVVTAYYFGAGATMDAFFTAQVIPYYLQLVLLGWLPFVLIPAFIQNEAAGRENEAWVLAGSFLRLGTITLVIIAIAGLFFASPLITAVSPGFEAEKSRMAAQMLRVMIFTVPLIGLATITGGIENVRNRFFWPAAATAVGSLGNLVMIIAFKPTIGPMALAWGALISASLQAGITTVPVLKHGWRGSFTLNDRQFIELIKLSVPFIVFGLVVYSRIVIERFFASSLPDGQLSYLGYANKISNIFVVLLAASISSAIFPTMARDYAAAGESGLALQTDHGMKLTLALAIPALTITSFLAIPLVRILFEHGQFDASSTLSVSILIPVVMINEVLFRMLGNVLARAFFVMKDTLTTNIVYSVTILIYGACAYYFTLRWGYFGLALAQPIQGGVATAIIFSILYKKVHGLSIRAAIKSLFQYVSIAVFAAFTGWGFIQILPIKSTWIQLFIGSGTAGIIYIWALSRVDKPISISILEMIGLPKIYHAVKTQFSSL